MIVPDINMLLYANVASFPQHAKARRWWERTLTEGTEVAIVAPVLFGFVRLATSRQVFSRPPLTVHTAMDLVGDWLSRPHVRFTLPGPRHLEIAFGLLRDLGAAGSLTTDAQIAAVAIEEQGEVHSADADFARFPRLRWVDPLRS